MFSFYANKTITTGEGGMVVSRDEKLVKRMKTMRLHGMSRDAFDRFTSTVPSWYYEIVAPGFKYNLTDIAAAIGIHQLRRADEFQRRRQAIAAGYDGRPGGPAAASARRSRRRTTSTPGTCIRSASAMPRRSAAMR